MLPGGLRLRADPGQGSSGQFWSHFPESSAFVVVLSRLTVAVGLTLRLQPRDAQVGAAGGAVDEAREHIRKLRGSFLVMICVDHEGEGHCLGTVGTSARICLQSPCCCRYRQWRPSSLETPTQSGAESAQPWPKILQEGVRSVRIGQVRFPVRIERPSSQLISRCPTEFTSGITCALIEKAEKGSP